jgi:Domain of unknown function (DUF6265)
MPGRIHLASAAGLAALSLSACATGPDPEVAGRLYFMVGCWQSADGANQEVWSLPRGGLMFGFATTLLADKPTFFEQTRIDLRDARATYTASPGGERPVVFTEAPSKPEIDKNGNPLPVTSVTFINPQHDYPQSITYRMEKKGLSATIARLDGSRPTNYSWEPCKAR